MNFQKSKPRSPRNVADAKSSGVWHIEASCLVGSRPGTASPSPAQQGELVGGPLDQLSDFTL